MIKTRNKPKKVRTPRVTTYVRLLEDEYGTLKGLAEREHRTIPAQLRHLLLDSLEREVQEARAE